LWLERSEIHGSGSFDSTVYNRHDPDSAYIGDYCGSIDTRKKPAQNLPPLYGIEGFFYQIISYPKQLKDLDSLEFFHMAIFRNEGIKSSAASYGSVLNFSRSSDGGLIEVWYAWLVPGSTPPPDSPTYKVLADTIPDEGIWFGVKRDLKADLIGEKGLSEDTELDTFLLFGASVYYNGTWRGQKVFLDRIRLTGYADYNIALTRLSGNLTYPAAIVWNNGYEDQTDVKIICYIEGDRPEPYADTVILLSLASDDSLEVFFRENQWISGSSDYYLGVVSGGFFDMNPDECDEGDRLTKYYPCGVSEDRPEPLTLEVLSSLTNPLRINYSLPYGEEGTLTLYDATGRRVEWMTVQGSGEVDFKSSLLSGGYIVRLEAGYSTVTKKAVILR
jgi:hypothetical protein